MEYKQSEEEIDEILSEMISLFIKRRLSRIEIIPLLEILYFKILQSLDFTVEAAESHIVDALHVCSREMNFKDSIKSPDTSNNKEFDISESVKNELDKLDPKDIEEYKEKMIQAKKQIDDVLESLDFSELDAMTIFMTYLHISCTDLEINLSDLHKVMDITAISKDLND